MSKKQKTKARRKRIFEEDRYRMSVEVTGRNRQTVIAAFTRAVESLNRDGWPETARFGVVCEEGRTNIFLGVRPLTERERIQQLEEIVVVMSGKKRAKEPKW
jgi:hypothetical protein